MTIEDIRKLVLGDETREVELKKTTGELKDAMHSACAFLNTDGGWLVFGVTPTSLKIVGQEVTENTRRELAQALAGLEPAVDVRVKHLEIPSEALREALINALCHRQYEKYNLTIGIAIYDDRIEIENPGMFPPQITLANIKEPHGSYPYNPLIADVLYKTSYLESWGSGVKRIVEACRKQNVPDPEWSLRGGFVTVTFRRSTQTNIITDDRKELVLELVPELVQSLSNQVKILITNLKEQEKSASELLLVPELVQSYSGKSPAYFKKQVIYPAMEQGLVAMLYPDKPRHPKQKYYLTEKGKACLDYLLEIE